MMTDNSTDSINLKIDNAVLDPTYQTLSTNDKVIRLREKLFLVLYYLTKRQNQLVSRDILIERCWQGNFYTGNKAITHTICHLRKLIRQLKLQATICTLPKQGYILYINQVNKNELQSELVPSNDYEELVS